MVLGPNGASSQQAGTSPTAREAFFTRIVHEHAHFLYRVAASVLRHPQDAEDAVQDALIKLYRGESWQDIADERAFLARVVWRSAIDSKARRTARPNVAEDGAEYRLPDDRATPEQSTADADERGLLQLWIDQLSPELREPLVLSAIEEMNSREIGSVMSLPEGTVRTRLMRARAELRAKWEDATRQRAVGNTETATPHTTPQNREGAAVS